MQDADLTSQIIRCTYKVHKQLGGGFLEKIYENALRIELELTGLQVTQQAPIKVLYAGQTIGQYFADLLVEKRIIVEIKAAQMLVRDNEIQLVNYLVATGYDNGLLINFGTSVEIKRKFREFKKSSLLTNLTNPTNRQN